MVAIRFFNDSLHIIAYRIFATLWRDLMVLLFRRHEKTIVRAPMYTQG